MLFLHAGWIACWDSSWSYSYAQGATVMLNVLIAGYDTKFPFLKSP